MLNDGLSITNFYGIISAGEYRLQGKRIWTLAVKYLAQVPRIPTGLEPLPLNASFG